MNLELREKTKKAAKTEATATTTRHIDFFKVSINPNIFIMDTPGILQPKIECNDVGLKMSVCGNIKDKIVGKRMICDYLLYQLNKNEYLDYVQVFKTKDKLFELDNLVKVISENYKIQDKNNVFDLILKNFSLGKLGKVTFDDQRDFSINNIL